MFRPSSTLLPLVLLALAAGPLHGGPRWRVEIVDGPHLETGDIELRSDGEPVAVWGGASVEIATRSAGTWTREALTPEPGSYWSPSLALDADDRPLVAWHDQEQGSLHFARFDGAAWQSEVVETEGVVGRWCSLALDPDGRPWIAYRDESGARLRLARHDGAAWTFETVSDTGDTGTWNALAIDSTGKAWIAHRDEAADSFLMASRDGGGWVLETIDAGFGGPGLHARIVLDGDEPVVAHHRRNGLAIQVARRTGGIWPREELGTGVSAFGLSLAPDGTLHVAGPGVQYWWHDGTGWQQRFAPGPLRLGSRIGGVAVDGSGATWILGHETMPEGTGLTRNNGGAVVATRRDAAGDWTQEVLRPGDDVAYGWNHSLDLALDREPALVVARRPWSMFAEEVVDYAWREAGEWRLESAGVPLSSRSVDLQHDSLGRPAFSYTESVSTTRLAERTDAGWRNELVSTQVNCCRTSMSFGPGDRPRVLFAGARGLYHSERDGIWPLETLSGSATDHMALVRLPDGRPAACFFGYLSATGAWRWSEFDGTGWPTVTIDARPGTGMEAVAAIGPEGRRWAASNFTSGLPAVTELLIAWSDDGENWTVEVVDPNHERFGRLSLAVLPDGRPVLLQGLNDNGGSTSGQLLLRRETDGSWTRLLYLPETSYVAPRSVAAAADGTLYVAYSAASSVRLAILAPSRRLHRGVVAELGPGWRDAALPFGPANDDETPPFPAEVEPGGRFEDAAPPSAPLVFYALFGESGEPSASEDLRVEKVPGSTALSLSF